MQPEIVGSSRTQLAPALRRAAAAATKVADALDIPMIASVVALPDGEPRLTDELVGLEPLVRTSISLFGHEPARGRMAQVGRRIMAVAGVSMEIAVLHTVLDARRAGFNVYVLVDCCGGLSARSEAAALTTMQATGAQISNVSSFFTSLVEDVDSTDGRAVMGALAELWSWDSAS